MGAVMNTRALELLLVVVLLLGALPLRASDGLDVRRIMTPAEFRAAGLEQLSPAQIDALNGWLMRYVAVEAPIVRESNAALKAEVRRQEGREIRSRIAGAFEGWSGNTLFRLENGQVWQQRLRGRWRHSADSPQVMIRKNLLGYWEMRVPGTGKQIGVRRIE
jgi:hypothetical protein